MIEPLPVYFVFCGVCVAISMPLTVDCCVYSNLEDYLCQRALPKCLISTLLRHKQLDLDAKRVLCIFIDHQQQCF